MTQLPTGRVRKPGFTRGGSITATAFQDEVAAASREMVSAIPAPLITTDVDGPMRTRRLDRGAEL
jgi:hypothetical protein